jgi:hypothetical protein
MPDVGSVPPAPGGQIGAAGPAGKPGGPGSGVPAAEGDSAAFRARLAAKLAARRAHQSIPPEHLAELIRVFNERGEAFESARLVSKYPITEKDDALYEVRTDRGTHRVIRGRDGGYTVFQ